MSNPRRQFAGSLFAGRLFANELWRGAAFAPTVFPLGPDLAPFARIKEWVPRPRPITYVPPAREIDCRPERVRDIDYAPPSRGVDYTPRPAS